MKAQNCISPDAIIAIAQTIGRCDFRTTVSLYTSCNNSPWVITVGESTWHRHLIVEHVSASVGGLDATLAILDQSESSKFGYEICTSKIEKHIELSKLVENHYISVKGALFPGRPKKTKVTLAQLQSMFVGKRLHIIDSVKSTFDGCDRGLCKGVYGSDHDFSVRMDMDEVLMGQKECTVGFTVEIATSTFVEGPLHADKGGRRKIMIVG